MHTTSSHDLAGDSSNLSLLQLFSDPEELRPQARTAAVVPARLPGAGTWLRAGEEITLLVFLFCFVLAITCTLWDLSSPPGDSEIEPGPWQ